MFSDEMLRSLPQNLEDMKNGLHGTEECVPTGIQRSYWAVSEPQVSSAPPPTKPSHAEYPEVMQLNIGGRRFEAMQSTLKNSGFFRHVLADKSKWRAELDGSYFLDADPDVFEHLLRFMRRPFVFPLFWSRAEGFDYALYHRLQTEAKLFEIDALHSWIESKKYIQAISVHRLKPVNENLADMEHQERAGNYSEDCYVVSLVPGCS
jgi:hypothetical protein